LVEWQDRTAEAIEFFKASAAASQRPALGCTSMCLDLAEKSRNQVQNFQNDRLRVTQTISRAV
jgi:hypothetical protein